MVVFEKLKKPDFSCLTNTLKDLFAKNALVIENSVIVMNKTIMAYSVHGMHEVCSLTMINDRLLARFDVVHFEECGYETCSYEIDLNDPSDLNHYELFVCELVEGQHHRVDVVEAKMFLKYNDRDAGYDYSSDDVKITGEWCIRYATVSL